MDLAERRPAGGDGRGLLAELGRGHRQSLERGPGGSRAVLAREQPLTGGPTDAETRAAASGGDVPGPIVYIDHSEVREGRLEELRAALRELAAWVEEHEPSLPGYSVYFSQDAGRVSVVHLHAEPASLALHMEVAGPRFAPFAKLVNLLRIDVYGDPGEAIVERLRDKARLLGTGTVAVHPFHAGFARLPPA